MYEIEFKNGEEEKAFSKGQSYVLGIGISKVVEMLIMTSYGGNTMILGTLLCFFAFALQLYRGSKLMYKINYALDIFMIVFSLFMVGQAFIAPVWASRRTSVLISFISFIVYSAWSMFIMRKSYIKFYLEKAGEIETAKKNKNI